MNKHEANMKTNGDSQESEFKLTEEQAQILSSSVEVTDEDEPYKSPFNRYVDGIAVSMDVADTCCSSFLSFSFVKIAFF